MRRRSHQDRTRHRAARRPHQRVVLENRVLHLLHERAVADSASHGKQHGELALHIVFVHLVENKLDEIKPLRRVLLALAPRLGVVLRNLLRHRVVRRIHKHDVKLHAIGDETWHLIEAATLYDVRIAIAVNQHVRRCKPIDKLVILDAVNVVLLDLILFGLRMTIGKRLRHRPNEKRAATACHIEHDRVLVHVANLGHEVRDMVRQ